MIHRFQSQSITITELCCWVNIPRSNYYYKPKQGKPGVKASTYTYSKTGEVVSNAYIVEEIHSILHREFADWGYEITTAILKREYIINKKKVYRLMNEHDLLLNKTIKTSGPREFVKYRSVEAAYPMENLSMDIKYIYVAGEARNYYLLSIIDIYSKKILQSMLSRSIKKKDVIDFLKRLNNRTSIKGVVIRNDNGPQFIAGQVKNFLRVAEVRQQFSRPATPQENCYIEAFHSILDHAVVMRNEFESYYQAKTTIDRFIEEYNNYRPHRSIGMLTPNVKWEQGMAERSSVRPNTEGETWARPMDTIEKEKPFNPSLLHGLDQVQGYEIGQTDELEKATLLLTCNKSFLHNLSKK